MIDFAEKHGVRIHAFTRPGFFNHQDSDLMAVWPPLDSDDAKKHLRQMVISGATRLPRQDIECSIEDVVEVAMRALSPGINDPVTAINCIDNLSAAQRLLSARPWPDDVILDSKDERRIKINNTSYANVMNGAFNMLRRNTVASVAVTCRLLQAPQTIAQVTDELGRQAEITRHAEIIMRGADRADHDEQDTSDIRSCFDAVLKTFEQPRLA